MNVSCPHVSSEVLVCKRKMTDVKTPEGFHDTSTVHLRAKQALDVYRSNI